MDTLSTRKTVGGKASVSTHAHTGVHPELAKILHSILRRNGKIKEHYRKATTATTATTVASRRLKKGQYKAHPELSKLAHSIRIGNNIDKNKPPEHITFELLLNEIGENKNKRNEIPIITEEEKAKVRIHMWKIWYKLMKGYSSYGKVSRLPLSSSKLLGSHTSSNGGGGGGKWKWKKKGTKIDIENEKAAIRKSFIDLYSNNKELQEDEIEYFDNTDLAKELVKTSLRQKEVVKGLNDDAIRMMSIRSEIKYQNPDGFTRLYQPINNVYMYGMQLPHQFDREKLLNTMLYLLTKKNIYNFVDLHDCEGGTNKGEYRILLGIGCNAYDRGCQTEMWSKALLALPHIPPTLYYGISGCKDMTPGTLGAWESIARIKDVTVPSNCVVIHCLGGAGRTGSVMLYLLLRDVFPNDTIRRLQHPHFGYASLNEFRNVMLGRFVNTSADEYTAGDIEYMKQEIFGVSKLAYASRFRQRLNRIFFFLARHFRVEQFYTYAIPTEPVAILPDDEFAVPIRRSFRDILDTRRSPQSSRSPQSPRMADIDIWNNYDKQKVIEWLN
jgi:hypothetical protein